MRKKIEWLFLTTVSSEAELEFYFQKFNAIASNHSNLNNCQICCDNTDGHKMRVRYPYCTCKPTCLTRYLIMTCTKTGKITVKGLNLHNIAEKLVVPVDLTKKGVSSKFKEIIENLIFNHNIFKPYSIYTKLLLDYHNETPSLIQIQNYIKYRRKKVGDVNSIEGLSEHVAGNTYKDIDPLNIAEEQPFYFGVDINDGSDEKHFHLGITSVRMLSHINNASTFHIDCTYKVIKYGFPLIVFGASDLNRKFFPICFMVTSNEQEIDFMFFWESLKQVTDHLNIELYSSIEYLCVDADRAMANSVSNNLKSTKLIMCWYHLIANINKNSKKIPVSMQDLVVGDIKHLHSTKFASNYEATKKKILKKWKSLRNLNDFVEYFEKQWLRPPFNNWQLFKTPAGFSMSNSPIENYNRKIKDFFLNRLKFNLLPVFEILENVVKIHSKELAKYEIPQCVSVTFTLRKESKVKSNLEMGTFVSTSSEDQLVYDFNKKHEVKINPECFCPECTNCSCAIFLDKAICLHLACCCRIAKVHYPGLEIKKFIRKNNSRKRKIGPWHEKDN